MGTSITIDNLDIEVLKRLQAEADRRGVDIGVVVNEVLKCSLAPTAKPSAACLHHELDELAGSWSDAEADAFLATVADFRRVDEDMWK